MTILLNKIGASAVLVVALRSAIIGLVPEAKAARAREPLAKRMAWTVAQIVHAIRRFETWIGGQWLGLARNKRKVYEFV